MNKPPLFFEALQHFAASVTTKMEQFIVGEPAEMLFHETGRSALVFDLHLPTELESTTHSIADYMYRDPPRSLGCTNVTNNVTAFVA